MTYPELRVRFLFSQSANVEDVLKYKSSLQKFFAYFDSLEQMLQLQFNDEGDIDSTEEIDELADHVSSSIQGNLAEIILSSPLMASMEEQEVVMQHILDEMNEVLAELKETPVEIQLHFINMLQ